MVNELPIGSGQKRVKRNLFRMRKEATGAAIKAHGYFISHWNKKPHE